MITSLSIGRGGLGRMGNQLFTIAGVIGIARRSGQPFGFHHWKNYDNALFGGEVTDFREIFVNQLPEIPEGIKFQEYPYFWEYKDVNLPTGNWNIHAHLQSVKWFRHCLDEVRHYFTMKYEPDQTELVAIHYRAGDYIDDPNAYHPRCSKEYYEKAMNLFPNSEFVVFSDNPDEAEKIIGVKSIFTYLKEKDFRFKYEKPDYIADFACMKKAKSFICANSSFSHMAALLGNHPEKKIIMPKLWFGKQSGLSFDMLYPEEAIIL